VAKAKPKPGPAPAAPDEPSGLTFRQRLFVAAYLGAAGGNGAEAARIAGFSHPNVQAVRLLANVSIRAAIDARLASAAMSADEVLARLSDLAAGSLGDFLAIDARGNYRVDLAKARRNGKLHLLRELKPTQHGTAIKLHDPKGALELLAKYHGLLDRIVLDDAKTEDLESHAAGADPGGD
jgi:hypothetical protein